MSEIDVLAAKIRAECLSGYNWNVPKHWRDVHPEARQRWRERAAEQHANRVVNDTKIGIAE